MSVYNPTLFWLIFYVVIILFLPGYCWVLYLQIYNLSHVGHKWTNIKWISFPLSFSISLSIISIIALLAYSFGFGLDWVIRVLYIVLISTSTGLISYLIFSPTVHVYIINSVKHRIQTGINHWRKLIAGEFKIIVTPIHYLKIDFLYLFLILFVVILAAYAGPYLSSGADTLYHLAATRSLLITNHPLPRQIFTNGSEVNLDPNSGTWHTAMAIIAIVAQADPLDVVWVLHVIVSGLLGLTLAIFTFEISQRINTTVLSILLFFIVGGAVSIRSLINPNLMGQIPFWTILILIIYYTKHYQSASVDLTSQKLNAISYLLLIALLSFNLSAIHLQYSPVLVALLLGSMILTGGSKLIRDIFPLTASYITGDVVPINSSSKNVQEDNSINKRKLKRLIISIEGKVKDTINSAIFQACSVSILSTLPMFIYRSSVVIDYNIAKTSGSSIPSTPSKLSLSGLLFPLHYKYYLSYEILHILAIILLIGLFVYWVRGDHGSILLITGVLLAPVSAILMGILFGSGGLVLTTVGRMVRITIPFLYIVWAWNLDSAFDIVKFKAVRKKKALFGRMALAVSVAVVSISPMVKGIDNFIKIYSPVSNYNASIINEKKSQLIQRTPGAIYVMKSLPAGSVILTDSMTSYEMSCFVSGLNFINIDRGKIPIQERAGYSEENSKKMRDLITGNLSLKEMIRLLLELDVDYVYVDREAKYGQVFWEVLTPIPIISVLYESDTWRLYEVRID